MFVTDLM